MVAGSSTIVQAVLAVPDEQQRCYVQAGGSQVSYPEPGVSRLALESFERLPTEGILCVDVLFGILVKLGGLGHQWELFLLTPGHQSPQFGGRSGHRRGCEPDTSNLDYNRLSGQGGFRVEEIISPLEAANSPLASVKYFVILVAHTGSGRHQSCRSNGSMGVQCGSCIISSTESDSNPQKYRKSLYSSDAGVVELVDTRDLKSLSREGVPVQVRPPVPYYLPKSSG